MPLQKPERCSGLPLPKFASRTQCACKFGRRPQLCLGCFCRRQRLGYAATHSSLFLPLAAVAVRAPAGRAKFTPVDRGKLCGKVNLKSDFSCCMFTVKEVAFRLKPHGGAPAGRRGYIYGPRAGFDQNNAGASLTADPRRGTLSFVTQSSFVLVRSTTEGTLVGHSFLLSHRMGVYPGLQTVSIICKPLTSNTVWCSVFVISKCSV